MKYLIKCKRWCDEEETRIRESVIDRLDAQNATDINSNILSSDKIKSTVTFYGFAVLALILAAGYAVYKFKVFDSTASAVLVIFLCCIEIVVIMKYIQAKDILYKRHCELYSIEKRVDALSTSKLVQKMLRVYTKYYVSDNDISFLKNALCRLGDIENLKLVEKAQEEGNETATFSLRASDDRLLACDVSVVKHKITNVFIIDKVVINLCNTEESEGIEEAVFDFNKEQKVIYIKSKGLDVSLVVSLMSLMSDGCCVDISIEN